MLIVGDRFDISFVLILLCVSSTSSSIYNVHETVATVDAQTEGVKGKEHDCF
jgi:hypothetical protein